MHLLEDGSCTTKSQFIVQGASRGVSDLEIVVQLTAGELNAFSSKRLNPASFVSVRRATSSRSLSDPEIGISGAEEVT